MKNCVAENRLTYSITGGNVGNAFEVSSDLGAIKVRGSLDYEDGPRVSEACTMLSAICYFSVPSASLRIFGSGRVS